MPAEVLHLPMGSPYTAIEYLLATPMGGRPKKGRRKGSTKKKSKQGGGKKSSEKKKRKRDSKGAYS